MQDIDFDEIDRAVSSVTNPATDTSVTTPVISPPPAPVDVAPAVEAEPTSAPETLTVAPVIAPQAARRSTGRFMDVVHASSDMRPPRVSAPSAPSLHRDEVITDRTEVADRPQPTTVASSAFHWPDPVEVSPPVLAPVVEAPVTTPVPIEAPVVPEEVAAPLESPFLADAKVEKRPLGAFSGADADLPLIEEPLSFSEGGYGATITDPTPEAEALLADPDPADVQPELKDDVSEIEDRAVEEEPEVAEIASIPATPVDVDDTPVGPTSITQQYKEQTSTDTQTSGAIFDTEAYHQPLVHTPKKHSGALVIVWIVALILVGGGIGAGVYFVVLPLLG